FDDQGRVTLEIDYLAYVEDFFDQRAYNVFADPTGKIGLDREFRALKMSKFSKECGDSQNNQQLENVKREFADVARKEVRKSVKSIVNSLSDNNRIYYLNVPYETISSFVSYGPYAPEEHLKLQTENLVFDSAEQDELLKERVDRALEPAGGGEGGYGEGANDEELDMLRAALIAINPNEHYVPFFYISDLIDLILVNIQKE
ncbi:MAG TPA: hypothetical protein DCM40_33210, partial [Maribacter sp.]|nr:hypothetical protein [Maribacter sp.]